MTPAPDISLDREKLKALVHYVCHRAPEDRLGKTKLNKILYYSDIEAYVALGAPITGEVYVKHQYGPVSAHIDEVLEELKAEQALAIAEASGFHVYSGQRYRQYRYVSLRRPSVQSFTADEIAIVEETLDDICQNYTAREISEASHGLVWQSARIGEELPYYTAFSHFVGEINPDDVRWADQHLASRR
ncbi:MAG: Panacea domain-containing protein [Bacteroidota bacterium]